MALDPLVAEIVSRYQKVRSGLDIGFDNPQISQMLRQLRGGVWMTICCHAAAVASVGRFLPPETTYSLESDGSLPFDDLQFEVAVLNGALISQVMVREIHRVLSQGGCLFFTVREDSSGRDGYNLPMLHKMFLRHGFDILAVRRPPWWRFGRDGKLMTVCARKKAWKERSGLNGRGGLLLDREGR